MSGYRDAYHSIKLSKVSNLIVAIFTFFGPTSYVYQRISMGLTATPAI